MNLLFNNGPFYEAINHILTLIHVITKKFQKFACNLIYTIGLVCIMYLCLDSDTFVIKNHVIADFWCCCKEMLSFHPLLQYLPPVDGRARCGFVGLKNGGATCYMNSVIQQLYMVPGIPEVVLGTEEDKPDEERSGVTNDLAYISV